MAPPSGPLGSGNFRPEKRAPGALAPHNDPQFLEHLDKLMSQQNTMEAQLIQMQTQLQSTNDILEQQAALLASAGLTPSSIVAQHQQQPAAAPAPSALPAAELRTSAGQAVSLAPPPEMDFGAPPMPPPVPGGPPPMPSGQPPMPGAPPPGYDAAGMGGPPMPGGPPPGYGGGGVGGMPNPNMGGMAGGAMPHMDPNMAPPPMPMGPPPGY